MSDLLCVPCRLGWQVGSSERRKLGRPSGAGQSGTNEGQPRLTDKLKNLPPRGQETRTSWETCRHGDMRHGTLGNSYSQRRSATVAARNVFLVGLTRLN